MQILYFLMIITGLPLVIIGSKWLLRFLLAKKIVQFPLCAVQREFEIKKKGLYSINFIGGWHAKATKGFKVRVIKVDNKKETNIIENTLKIKIRRRMKRGVELFKFIIQEEGTYRIEFINQKDLIIKRSNLFPFYQFETAIQTEHIQVLIKESIANWQLIIGIIFLVIGGNTFLWGIILGTTPYL